MLLWHALYLGYCTQQSCTLLCVCFCAQGSGEEWWCQAPPLCIPTFRTVHYNPTSTKHFSFSVGSVPRALQPQLGILRYFASYMEQHLMKVCGLWWGHFRDGRCDQRRVAQR